jgi:opacity protein-like surface antigen
MTKTKHITLVLLCLLTLASAVSGKLLAQAMPAASGPGGYVSVGVGASLYRFQYGQRDLAGIMAYTDAMAVWRYGFEGEVRSLRFNTSEDVTETTYMAGPRIVIFPGPLRPYVKLLAGAGHYNLPFGFATGTFFTYAPGAGVDYALTDTVAIRVIDFEYQVSNRFQASPYEPESNLVNVGISAGISIRLNPIQHFPHAFHYKKRQYGRGGLEE